MEQIMKRFFRSSIITSLILLLLGILLIFQSETTIMMISYVIGGVLVAIGVLALIRYVNAGDSPAARNELDIVYGIVTAIFGIIIMCLLMGFLIYKTLKIVYLNKNDNYNDFLNEFIKNKKINFTISLIINILLLFSFYIMVAGFGAYFEQELGINTYIGSIGFALFCSIVFFLNVNGVLKISNIIVPLLIMFIVFIGIKNIFYLKDIELIQIKNNWLNSSIIYTSYNLILLIPVLISLRNQITQEKNIKYIAIFSSGLMIFLSIMIFLLLLNENIICLRKQEMPAVYVISKNFSQYRNLYAFIILASIFTTAISVGIGFLKNVSKNKKSYTQVVIFMCITSVLITKFGFSKILNFIYPIFGYIGIIQIILLITKKLRNNIAKS